MKKHYEKPEAEVITFQVEEDLMVDADIEDVPTSIGGTGTLPVER